MITQRSYDPFVTKEDEPHQPIMISSTDRAKSTVLVKIDIQDRLTDECREENNFISVTRRSFKQYSKETMAREGIFHIERDTIIVHVVPDFLNKDLITKQQVING